MRIVQHVHAPYLSTLADMQAFTQARSALTPDELWVCSHPPTFTLGLAGLAAHVLAPGGVPVVQTDRGGQVTYHGPGQVVAYPLIDLKRAGYFVKEYVFRVEEAVIRTLAQWGVTGHRVRGAPGIYVRLADPASHACLPEGFGVQDMLAPHSPHSPHSPARLGKIAALGIKVSRHCTYHGVALNVAMDLQPFSRINPCGYAGLQTVDLSTIGINLLWQDAADVFSHHLARQLIP